MGNDQNDGEIQSLTFIIIIFENLAAISLSVSFSSTFRQNKKEDSSFVFFCVFVHRQIRSAFSDSFSPNYFAARHCCRNCWNWMAVCLFWEAFRLLRIYQLLSQWSHVHTYYTTGFSRRVCRHRSAINKAISTPWKCTWIVLQQKHFSTVRKKTTC